MTTILAAIVLGVLSLACLGTVICLVAMPIYFVFVLKERVK